MQEEFSESIRRQPLSPHLGGTETLLAEALVPTPWKRDLWAGSGLERRYKGCEEYMRWEEDWDYSEPLFSGFAIVTEVYERQP